MSSDVMWDSWRGWNVRGDDTQATSVPRRPATVTSGCRPSSNQPISGNESRGNASSLQRNPGVRQRKREGPRDLAEGGTNGGPQILSVMVVVYH